MPCEIPLKRWWPQAPGAEGEAAVSGVFVTGTDTEVGKTYVSVLAAKWLRAHGVDVGVMKPVETGCVEIDGRLVAADAQALVAAAGVADEMSLVVPCPLRKPLAPLVAAELEGTSVDVPTILESFRELSARHSFMIVEGAGGLLVPLTEECTMLDLALQMELPLVIVTASKLGAINHSLLTLEVAKARGLSVAALIVNFLTPESDEAQRTNAMTLGDLVSVPVLEIPYGGGREGPGFLGELMLELMG
jgi:dethiobiotin synthetase